MRMAAVLAALILWASAASAGDPGTPKSAAPKTVKASAPDDGITRAQANAILEELRGIRRLLEAQPLPARRVPPEAAGAERPHVKVRLAAAPAVTLGRAEAPVTIVEYIDFQCGFCKRHQDQVMAQLKERFIDKGIVRYVSHNLPLEMHSNALAAAKAARCAAAQNRYWEMRAALFDDPAHLAEADTLEDARKLGLDMKAYEACLRDEASTASVKSEAAEAEKLGINGTPAFVIGRTGGDEMDGAVVLGAQPLPAFEAQIGELVSKKEILPKVDAGSQ